MHAPPRSLALAGNRKPQRVLIYTRYRNFYVGLMRKIKVEYESKLLLESKGNTKRL